MEDMIFACDKCNLTFPNIHLLERHQEKFCSYDTLQSNMATLQTPHLIIPKSIPVILKEDLRKQALNLELQRKELSKQLREICWRENFDDDMFSTYDYLETSNKFEARDIRHKRPLNESFEKSIHSSRLPKHIAWSVPLYEKVQTEAKNRLLNEARLMYRDYIESGGNDEDVFGYFNQLFNEISNLGERNDNSTKTGSVLSFFCLN